MPVQSVQEIVRNDSQSVPARYIQEHKNRPLVTEIFDASLEIPIIDFSLLAKGDEHERRKLDLACKEWGFFKVNKQRCLYMFLFFNEVYEINAILLLQIINHGVEEEVLHKKKATVAAFFELPLEEKKKYAMAAMMFMDMEKPM